MSNESLLSSEALLHLVKLTATNKLDNEYLSLCNELLSLAMWCPSLPLHM